MILDNLSISPTGICITYETIRTEEKRHYSNGNIFDISKEKGTVKGDLSFNSITRLKKAFYTLAAISEKKYFINGTTNKKIPYRLTFITLTLSAAQGQHTDKAIKHELLNHFLIIAKRSFGVTHYIWKAETQKNNNIHFHIVTNKYIDHRQLRDTWNNIQSKLGYINLFNEKYNHINPNSTDIHSINEIKKLGSYVAKYISKNDIENRKINGKIWDCSRNLKSKEKCKFIIVGNDYDILYKLEEKYSNRIIYHDFFRFIPLGEKELKNDLPTPWKEKYINYLNTIKQL